MMYRYEGFDVNGIARVFGQDASEEMALRDCKEEAADYVRRRPDTGPLSSWNFVAAHPHRTILD